MTDGRDQIGRLSSVICYDKGSAMNEPNNEAKWVLGLAAVASLMVALDALVLSTALTEIGRAFDASIEWLEWTANAYILSFAVLLITAAAMGDRFGRRRLRGPCKALAPQ